MISNAYMVILFQEFLPSQDTLRVYQEADCIFRSDKDVLAPLVEYIARSGSQQNQVVIMDKIMGHAAALLAIKAGAIRVYSPLGSEPASRVLNQYGIEYYLERMVPYILAPDGKDICPMEKLSLDKNPDEFYQIIRSRFEAASRPSENPAPGKK